MLVPWLQRSSALYRVHASAVKTSLHGLLPANTKSGRPRRDQVSGGNRKVGQHRRSQTGPRALLQEREEVQREGWSNLEGCKTPSRMLATPIRRLRDAADLLQKIANKGHAQLTGDSPVEAREGGRRHLISLGRSSRVCRSWSTGPTDNEYVSAHIFIGQCVLTRSFSERVISGIHGTPWQEIVARLLQGD